MFFMLLVNVIWTCGKQKYLSTLFHSSWNGLTLADVIFPVFLTIMGVSIGMVYKKYDYKLSKQTFLKIIRKFVIIFALGILLNLISQCWNNLNTHRNFFYMQDFRVLGVLQRFAICYLVVSLCVLTFSIKINLLIASFILLSYSILLLAGHGYDESSQNVLNIVDKAILGRHSNHWGGHDFDSEGILSTIPSIAQVFIGYSLSFVIVNDKDLKQRIFNLFLIGICLLLTGLFFAIFLPINKDVWSPTYVLITCGIFCLMMGLIMYLVDYKNIIKPFSPLRAMGCNSLFIYFISEIIELILSMWIIRDKLLCDYIYFGFYKIAFGATFGAFMYALVFSTFCSGIAYLLYWKKVIIRI